VTALASTAQTPLVSHGTCLSESYRAAWSARETSLVRSRGFASRCSSAARKPSGSSRRFEVKIPELASYLRIEEREFETGGRNEASVGVDVDWEASWS
jgi:hypothetical protein